MNLENTEVTQLHIPPLGQRIGDRVEGQLDHLADFLLRESRLVIDAQHDVAFRLAPLVPESLISEKIFDARA